MSTTTIVLGILAIVYLLVSTKNTKGKGKPINATPRKQPSDASNDRAHEVKPKSYITCVFFDMEDGTKDFQSNGTIPTSRPYTFSFDPEKTEVEVGDVITDSDSYNRENYGCMYVSGFAREYSGRVKRLNIRTVRTLFNGLLVDKAQLPAVKSLMSHGSPFFMGKVFAREAYGFDMEIAKELIERSGGILRQNISKDTSYLVVNDLNRLPAKAETAKTHKTKIISFSQMLELATSARDAQ